MSEFPEQGSSDIVRVSLTEVVVHCEGTEVARHRRSYVPADVVLAPAHVRALRLAREARSRLVQGDVKLPEVDLRRYDALAGAGPAGSSPWSLADDGSHDLPGAGFREMAAR